MIFILPTLILTQTEQGLLSYMFTCKLPLYLSTISFWGGPQQSSADSDKVGTPVKDLDTRVCQILRHITYMKTFKATCWITLPAFHMNIFGIGKMYDIRIANYQHVYWAGLAMQYIRHILYRIIYNDISYVTYDMSDCLSYNSFQYFENKLLQNWLWNFEHLF